MTIPNMFALLALVSSAAASCTDFAGNKCNGCLATNNVCYPGMPKKQCNMYPGFQFCEDTPRICCEALTAECLSCSEGITEEEYCAKNPDTVGCPKPCCYALTAECLSCAEGITEEEYCAKNPDTIGCPEPVVCCHAETATCEACKAGVSVEEYCAENPQMDGCGFAA